MSALPTWRPTRPKGPRGTSLEQPAGTVARERITPRWPGALLGVSSAIAIVAGILAIGPPGGATTRARIVTAQRGVVQSSASGSGTIQPVTTANANFRAGGQVSRVYVRQGRFVASGQPLAQLDPASANANLGAAQANLDSANAKLAQVQSGASSSQSTSAPSSSGTGGGQSSGGKTSGATTTATSSPTAADVESAAAAVRTAQAGVVSAQKAVDDTVLRAPVSGTVTSLNGQVGDAVGSGGGGSSAGGSSSGSSGSSSSTGSNAGGGGTAGGGGSAGGAASSSSSSSGSSGSASSAFAVITDLDNVQVKVPMSESDIHRVKLNQSANVTVNAVPGEKLAAHVRAIDSAPTTSNGVVSYMVTLALDQSAAGLKPGMTASAQVVVSQVDGVVTVPSSAISRRGAASTVTVVKGGKKSVRAVVTGATGDSAVEIVSGLSPGEQVAIAIPTGTSAGATSGSGGGGGLRGGFGGGFGGGGGFRGGGGGGGGGGPGGPPG